MKFVLASYGTRGDVEPSVAVGRELLRRRHEVRMAVPPDLLDFVESVGLTAVAAGPDSQLFVDSVHRTWTSRSSVLTRIGSWREHRQLHARCWREMGAAVTPLADGADVLLTSMHLEEAAANIAEYHDIPLATLHHSPLRANGSVMPVRPSPLIRSAMAGKEVLMHWQLSKKTDDAQRCELGLPRAIGPASERMAKRGTLEIQAYDEVCFPGLAAEWARWAGRRPFVGTLNLELSTDADDDVAPWIAAGTPPICFGFGSLRIESPRDTVAMITAACAQLGERALICSGSTDFSDVPLVDHIKVVGAVNYAAVWPACRAVVHHGGAGTTAAGVRAGVPTLSLWRFRDQSIWGAQVTHLKVGTARSFSATTRESLVSDLRQILDPQYVTRAREFASRMTKPAESVAHCADLLENFAHAGRVG